MNEPGSLDDHGNMRHECVGEGTRRTVTKSGAAFDPTADHWSYEDGLHTISLNFSGLIGLSHQLREGAKAVLGWYAANRSPDHLDNLFYRLKHFSRWLISVGEPIDEISEVHFINYRSSLSLNTQWYAGTLAGFFKKWHNLGYRGIKPALFSLLSQLKLKGNQKGVPVLIMDPLTGPLSHIESEAIQDALNDAYSTGKVEEWEFVLCWLFILLGQRSKQFAGLKVCDVRASTDKFGQQSFSLMVPRAKQQKANVRAELKERRLVEQFGTLLFQYAERVRETFAGVLADPTQAPLFPAKQSRTSAGEYSLHWTSDEIGMQATRVFSSLSVKSERTGGRIHITTTRFRRTIGTRAAEEGHGPLIIAEMLDHSDTQNVGVYSANSPAISERIDRAVALQMAPLAQAFAGTLTNNSTSDSRTNRIIDLRIDQSGQAMGKCGQHGFCGFAAPIACYTCKSFEAWIDGPHEAVLNHLLARRDQLLNTSDERIASINDRSILAVASVVQKCAELNAKKLPSVAQKVAK